MSQKSVESGPTIPKKIGKYLIVKHVATGGMGTVYKAKDSTNSNSVALKVLNPSTGKHTNMLQRFQREARSASSLKHPHIVEVYEIDNDEGTWFIAMEYVRGMDLLDYIEQKKRLTPRECRRMIFQAAQALHHAHQQGVVHRDIKPSNFLLTAEDGKPIVKLTDFGLARIVDDEEFRLTRTGSTVGTVDYISPEQARNSNSADIRSDIYSLGCTLYHMLAGHAPFSEGGLTERLYKHSEEPPPDIRNFSPEIPEYLEAILYRMLEKSPDRRFQTPKELIEAIALGEEFETIDTGALLNQLAEEEEPVPERTLPVKRAKAKPTPAPLPKDIPPPMPEEYYDDDEEELESEEEVDIRGHLHDDKRKTDSLSSAKKGRLLIGAGIGVGVLLIAIVLMSLGGSGKRKDDNRSANADDSAIIKDRDSTPSKDGLTFPIDDNLPKDDKKKDDTPPKKDDTEVPQKDKQNPKAPEKEQWPLLTPEVAELDNDTIQKQMQNEWKAPPEPASDAFKIRVHRLPTDENTVATLNEALKAAEKSDKKDVIVELADNGPLYTGSLTLKDKNLFLRAGKDLRPLLIWLPEKKGDSNSSGFFKMEKGSIHLRGMQLAASLDATFEEEDPSLFDITEGSFFADDCTFSLAGGPSKEVDLVQLHAKDHQAQFLLKRCYSRGRSLTVLDADSSGVHAIIDHSLILGGKHTLFTLVTDEARVTHLKMIRSTIVTERQCLALTSPSKLAIEPRFVWKMWDSLLTRTGSTTSSILFSISDQLHSTKLQVEAWNCLYCGWQSLFSGKNPLTSRQHSNWQVRWSDKPKVDKARYQPWPIGTFQRLTNVTAQEYRTDRFKGEPVGYTATSGEGTIGCNVNALSPSIDNWMSMTVQRFTSPRPGLPLEEEPPPIPMIRDGKYHGGRIDVSRFDVGAELKKIADRWPLAPKVVLHLFQSDPRRRTVPTSPIKIKGSDLVLYLEPPMKRRNSEEKDKEDENQGPRLSFVGTARTTGGQDGLIQVEDGNLDIIGGTIRLPDFQAALIPPYLIAVKNGNVRTMDCRLDGPRFDAPRHFLGLILLDIGQQKDHGITVCRLERSSLLTSGTCVSLKGNTGQIWLENSLLISKDNIVQVESSKESAKADNIYIGFERSTLAAGKAMLHLKSETASHPWPKVWVQSQFMVFANPFSTKSGIARMDKDIMQQGIVTWQSQRDVFDQRLWYRVASETIPEKQQSHDIWQRVWGPLGQKESILHLQWERKLGSTKWYPALLRLTPPRTGPKINVGQLGADLVDLGWMKDSSRR